MKVGEAVAVALALGAGTMAYRLAFAELRRRGWRHGSFDAALEWLPVAVLAALVAPALVPAEGLSGAGPSLGAALVCGVVTYRTRNLLLSIALGLSAFWALGSF